MQTLSVDNIGSKTLNTQDSDNESEDDAMVILLKNNKNVAKAANTASEGFSNTALEAKAKELDKLAGVQEEEEKKEAEPEYVINSNETNKYKEERYIRYCLEASKNPKLKNDM